MNRYDASCIITEIKVAGAHKCKYLLSVKDIFLSNGYICLVTDYARKGDLSYYIKRRRSAGRPLEEGLIWDILLQMLIGLQYLHHHNVIHRDIKSLNIFLTNDKKVLMGDFGISKILKSSGIGTGTQIGTPLYSSPEMVKNRRYDNKIDIWALGCVLWEMMSMYPAFNAQNAHLLNRRILSGLCSSSIPSGRYSSNLMELAKKMIDINVNTRPDINQIMNMACVRMRMEGSGLVLNDFSDYSVIRGFQTAIYPPHRIGDWDRVCKKLREILGIDDEDLFSEKKDYMPAINIMRNYQNNYNQNIHVPRVRLPPTRQLPAISRGQISRAPMAPPWAMHYN